MKTLDRYIASFFFRNLAIGVMALCGLFLFQAMFGDLYDRGYPLRQAFYYNWLSVPRIIVEMAPVSTLMATVLTLSGLSRTNELVACYAIGIGLKRIMTIILSIVLVVSSLILVMEDRLLPPFFKMRKTYYHRVMRNEPDFFMDLKRDKIWYRSKNMIYNLMRFDSASNTILGMSVYTFDDNFNLTEVVEAERAEFTPRGWKLRDGTVTLFSPESAFPLAKGFTEKEIFISETPKDFQEIDKQVEGLRFKELYQYIQRMKGAGADTKAYETQFHARFGLGFVPIVMCFLAIPFSLGTRRAGGVARDVGLCLAVTFSYWLFYSLSLSLGANGALPPRLAAWLPSMVFVALAVVLIMRKRA